MSLAAPTESLQLGGLDGKVEIVVDRWGIPHVFATTEADAFFGQGFSAARDRLWQMDLWRKRCLGLLARDFGPAFIEHDRAARLLLYRGDMEPEWSAYGLRAKQWTEAFVHGINAYVALVRERPERQPIEFLITQTTPDQWAADDIVRCRGHARVRNLESEVERANILAHLGTEAVGAHKRLDPPWHLTLPEGYLREPVPARVMETYRLATAPVAFDPQALAPVLVDDPAGVEGSNSWALRPSRTTTGRAILASDPHRVHQMPPLRYVSHLSAPGLNVIGAGEPAVPGVSLGHNEHIAFGLTIFPADQEDLYVYELQATDPAYFRYQDGWERIETVRESIAVRGAGEHTAELRFTRHGPLLFEDSHSGRAYGLRSAWSEPGTAPYLASLGYLQASDWDGFVAALEGWGAPTVNHVYADVDGNVGWVTAGKIPRRGNWDGLLPVPGDGRFEWDGFMPARAHPQEFNPRRGWVASANQMNLPPGFDHARHKTGFEFADRSRFERIAEVLDSRERHDIEDTLALQTDVLSIPARRVVALLSDLNDADPVVERALHLVRDWNHRLEPDSAAAALFEVWFQRHLVPATIERLGGPGILDFVTLPDTALVVDTLEAPDSRFGADPERARDLMLRDTLRAAVFEAQTLLGDDWSGWAWGRLHQALFEHPLAEAAGPALRARLNVGPVAKGGSSLTVNNNGNRPGSFRIVHGATWRMVVDVGDWDASWTVNAPGQSGDPRSAHYRDLAEHRAGESYVPLLFSREAVDASAESVTVLEPED